jgi:hypothetical protein
MAGSRRHSGPPTSDEAIAPHGRRPAPTVSDAAEPPLAPEHACELGSEQPQRLSKCMECSTNELTAAFCGCRSEAGGITRRSTTPHRPERARRGGGRRKAPHPRGSTSLIATLGSCNRRPLFAPALAANGIPVSDRPCPAIRAKRGCPSRDRDACAAMNAGALPLAGVPRLSSYAGACSAG